MELHHFFLFLAIILADRRSSRHDLGRDRWYIPSFVDSYRCRFEAAVSNSTGLSPQMWRRFQLENTGMTFSQVRQGLISQLVVPDMQLFNYI
jgi:hypothetical protein